MNYFTAKFCRGLVLRPKFSLLNFVATDCNVVFADSFVGEAVTRKQIGRCFLEFSYATFSKPIGKRSLGCCFASHYRGDDCHFAVTFS